MTLARTIETLSNAPGVSGFEGPVLQAARDILPKDVIVSEDRIRNLYIQKKSASARPCVVMLDAHSDEVGFMVQAVNADGTLKFTPLGGWNPQALSAQPVRVLNGKGRWLRGVVASRPTHFMSPEEAAKPLAITSMAIDLGAGSATEAVQDFHIQVGAPVVPDVTFSRDADKGLLFGKAFDDRLGCALVLDIMSRNLSLHPDLSVTGALSSQEELGLRGVKVAVETVKPDIAICLEGTPADDTLGNPGFVQAGLKKGPQIRHLDQSVLPNPGFVRFAVDTAREKQIPFQQAVRSSGGNNAGVITLHDRGIPTITIGVPVRYIHSHNGIAALADVEAAGRWCAAILESLTPERIESF